MTKDRDPFAIYSPIPPGYQADREGSPASAVSYQSPSIVETFQLSKGSDRLSDEGYVSSCISSPPQSPRFHTAAVSSDTEAEEETWQLGADISDSEEETLSGIPQPQHQESNSENEVEDEEEGEEEEGGEAGKEEGDKDQLFFRERQIRLTNASVVHAIVSDSEEEEMEGERTRQLQADDASVFVSDTEAQIESLNS
jgi:hypothetical protein